MALLVGTCGVSLTASASSSATPNIGGGILDAGLLGEYFDNDNLTGDPVFTRRDPRLDFDWGSLIKPGGGMQGTLRQAIGTDGYSVRWSGRIMPRFSETYTFTAQVDDGVRLQIRGDGASSWTTLIDKWSSVGTHTADYAMSAEQAYEIQVEYREISGDAEMRLSWSSPSTPEEILEAAHINGRHAIKRQDSVANLWYAIREIDAVDSDGWPSEDFIIYIDISQDDMEHGTYYVEFQGKAKLDVTHAQWSSVDGSTDFGEKVLESGEGYDAATNTTRAIFTWDSAIDVLDQTWDFEETQRDASSAVNTGITNIKIMRPTAPGAATWCDPEALFSDLHLDANQYFKAVRYLDINGMSTHVPVWEHRKRLQPTLRDLDGNKKMINLEYKILLANALGSDLWLCLPHGASDDYIEKVAQVCRYGSDGLNPYTSLQSDPVFPPLNSNLRLYVEYSNEVPWNSRGDFPQSSWVYSESADQLDAGGAIADILNYDGRFVKTDDEWNDGFIRACRYQAMRTVDISTIFRSVHGDANMHRRVRPILSYWSDNRNNHADHLFSFLDGYYNNAEGNHVASPHPVTHYIYGGGSTSYYSSGNKLGSDDRISVPDAGFENATVDVGMAELAPTDSDWSFTGTAGVYNKAARSSAFSLISAGATTNTVDDHVWRGFQFTVGSDTVAAYEVGLYRLPGNSGSKTVMIWDVDKGGLIYKNQSVDLSSATEGSFAYHRFTYDSQYSGPYYQPVIFEAGKSYYVLVQESNGGDDFYDESTSIEGPSQVTIDGAVKAYKDGDGDWHFEQTASGDHCYRPIDFQLATTPVRSADSSIDLAYPLDPDVGEQALFLAGTGSASIDVDLPEAGTYALYYRVAGRSDENDIGGGEDLMNSLDVFLDGSRITPSGAADIYPGDSAWLHGRYIFGRETNSFDGYGSAPFTVDAGGSYTITLQGGEADSNKAVYVDEIQVTSTQAILDGGVPGAGGATGDISKTDWLSERKRRHVYAQAFGLQATAYEGGWFTGDFTKTPMQNWFVIKDAGATQGEEDFLEIMGQIGMRLTMQLVNYTNALPRELDTYDDDAQAVAWQHHQDALPAEDSNGMQVPSRLSPLGATWAVDANKDSGVIAERGGFLAWNIIAPDTGEYELQATTSGGGSYQLVLDGGEVLLEEDVGGSVSNDSVSLTKGLHALRLQSTSGSLEVVELTLQKAGTPANPQLLVLRNGSNSDEALLKWSAVDGASGYVVRYDDRPGLLGSSVDVGDALEATVDGLSEGEIYYFAISAKNSAGLGVPSEEQTLLMGIDETKYYLQDDSDQQLISLEAENYFRNHAPAGASDQWVFSDADNLGDYSGSGMMVAGIDDGDNLDPSADIYLEYLLHIRESGAHYLWLRSKTFGGGSNSVHVGLNRDRDAAADWSLGSWSSREITIPSSGLQLLDIWMREDGTAIDKIVITTDANYDPTAVNNGLGPDDSQTASELAALNLDTSNLVAAEEGSAYNENLQASGGDGNYDWLLWQGALPAGLSLASDGTLSGTPAAGSAGSYDVTIMVTDGFGNDATAELTLEVTGGEVTTRYEAEDYTAQEGTTTKTGNDSTGSFQDYGGSGTYIEWNNIDGGSGGEAMLDINYALGYASRFCDIYVNGESTPSVSELEFPNTGSWSTWDTVSASVTLNSGSNTIRIQASPNSQGPNIDYMEVTVGGSGGGATVIAEDDSDSVDEGGSKSV
ncbi:MAG: carbohydrate-binding protein, partial [Planctomycetota bacterium]